MYNISYGPLCHQCRMNHMRLMTVNWTFPPCLKTFSIHPCGTLDTHQVTVELGQRHTLQFIEVHHYTMHYALYVYSFAHYLTSVFLILSLILLIFPSTGILSGQRSSSYLVYTTGKGFPPNILGVPDAMKGIGTVFMLALLTGELI